MTNNYRPPDLYLPLNTEAWAPGSINLPYSDLEIWAMSFYDEILLRNPDGLINGRSMATIISRCIPSIKNPWLIPEHDYQYIVAGLTLASYGNKLTVKVKCDKCKESNEYEFNIQNFLGTQTHSTSKTFSIGDLQFVLGDAVYKDLVVYRNNNYGLLKSITNIQKNPEVAFDVELLQKEINQYRKNELWLKSRRIKQIKVSSVQVIDQPDQIKSLVESFDKTTMAQLDILALNNNKINTQTFNCGSCNHKNSTAIALDPAEQFYRQLINTNDDNMEKLFESMDNEVKEIRKEVARLVWFMRGSVSYAECLQMSQAERNSLGDQIKDNIETMKKTKMPMF